MTRGSPSRLAPLIGAIFVLPNPNGPIPTDTFIGEPGLDQYDSERLTLGWLLRHDLGDRWTVRQSLRWARNEVTYRTLYADAFSRPGG